MLVGQHDSSPRKIEAAGDEPTASGINHQSTARASRDSSAQIRFIGGKNTLGAKLLDFETSHFTSPSNFVSQHWRIADAIFKRIFSNSRAHRAAKKAANNVIPANRYH
jgi:hypothetical protein